MSGTAPVTGTATRPGGSRPGVPRPVAAVLQAPFTRRAWAELGYAMAGLPLGAAGFAFTVATLAAGAALTLTLVGILVGLPLLAVSSLGARGLGAVNRGLARRLLGVRVAAPPPFRPQPGLIVWVRSALTDTAGWRARAYLVLKLPVAVLSGFVAAYFWLGGLAYLTYPLWWQVFHQVAVHVGGVTRPDPVTTPGPFGNVHILTLPGTFLVIPIGAIWVLAAPWATRAANALDRLLIRELLGPVSLSQRVHDLEQTRAYAVGESAARLRSIERDLHDGTQAQLVAVAMKLGLAMKKLGTSDDAAGGEFDLERARELVDAAHRSAKEAIADLRDLARGIHPPVLDTGLDAALATLATRSTVPVDLIVDVPQRPPPAIETIAYYCTAELLANVAKHSRARHAAIEAVQLPGLLRLRVTDDGTGDARLNDGGGLAGLASRVRTVDGRLEISSPHGGPTRGDHRNAVRHRRACRMRIVIAEDSAVLRAGLAEILKDSGHEVAAAVGDADALRAAIEAHHPDVAVVDVRMPPTHTDDGLRAAVALRREHPKLGVLVFSQYIETRYAAELLGVASPRGAAGVGYLLKDRVADVDEFVGALGRVAAGGTALDPEVVAQLLRASPRAAALAALTPRERHVLALMAEGRSNGAIAGLLVVSERAIEKHVGNIFSKLGLPPSDADHRRVLAVLRYLES